MNPLKLIPEGYATKITGGLMMLGAVGLFADVAAQLMGSDLYPSVSTWNGAAEMFLLGLGLLGLRRAIENK